MTQLIPQSKITKQWLVLACFLSLGSFPSDVAFYCGEKEYNIINRQTTTPHHHILIILYPISILKRYFTFLLGQPKSRDRLVRLLVTFFVV